MRTRAWVLLFLTLTLAALAAIAFGSVSLSLSTVVDALMGRGAADAEMIVRVLRLPRVALGIAVGAGLGMSGAALQANLRNALAEPYLLGVSGCAAVGAVLATSLSVTAPGLVPLAAFAGAVVAVLAVLAVAQAARGPGDARVLVMAGVVVGAFANAAIMIVMSNVPDQTVRSALWWMMGSLGDASWAGVRWTAGYVALGGALLMVYGREIELLALGDEPALALGVDTVAATRRIFLISSLLAAVTVAAAGLVGFVGLVVPAIARSLGARTVRGTILASAVTGATLVVAADLAARVARAPAELPLGAVTALVGVPFFLLRLRRMS